MKKNFKHIPNIRNWVTTLFLLLNCIVTNFAQNYNYQFKHLITDDGLSSSEVACIHQDSKGYIWIGTYNGLNRYDGKEFVVYKNIPGDSTSMMDNCCKSIFEDKHQNLFFATFRGLCIYNRNTDCFINLPYDQNSALFNHKEPIFQLTGDLDSILWLGTSFGLLRFDYKNNHVDHYLNQPQNASSLCENFIEGVYLDRCNRLWVATHSGLDMMVDNSGIFNHIDYNHPETKSISKIYFTKVIEDSESNLWFGSNEGLFFLEKGNQTKKNDLVQYVHQLGISKSLSHNSIIFLYIDKQGVLWIGTENGGINIFNKQSNSFEHILIDPFNPNSLNNQSIYSIIEDRNDNLWVGAYGGGLNIASKNSDFIRLYKHLPGAPDGLGHSIVRGFCEDKNNHIWVATDGGGLNLFNKQTGRFKKYNTGNSKISSDAILCIVEGNDNDIWLGTWAGGLVKFNTKSEVFQSFNAKNSDISDDNIHSIAKDKNGNLWIGTQKGGLVYFDLSKNRFKTYWPNNSGLRSERVSVVKINKQGLVYMGSTNFFQILNPATDEFETYSNDPSSTESMSNNAVFDILFENDTSVWIATGLGLNRFNPVTKKFKRYFKSDGLPDNIICALCFDSLKNLWITTNKGISRFDSKTNTFKNFTMADGLQGNEFNQKSMLVLNDGSILAGGKSGFNMIAPWRLTNNQKIPDVILTNFFIANQKVIPGAKGSPLEKQISETQQMTLNYKQSVLTFYFAALDYTNPQKNQYAYMMENFDEDWIYSENRNQATYTNLNPGKYIFRVKASNNDGVWNETGTSIKITITPPWWKSLVAFICYIVLGFSLFLAFYLYRINQLEKQKKKLAILVEKRTEELANKNELLNAQTLVLREANSLLIERQKEIEEKNQLLIKQTNELNETNTILEERQMRIEEQSEELSAQKEELQTQRDNLFELNNTKDKLFSIIGHDLRNPFNSILGFTELLIRKFRQYSPEVIEFQLGYINTATQNTLVLLNNLLEWSKTQRSILHLEPQPVVFSSILNDELRLLEQQAKHKEINLHITFTGEEITIEADLSTMSTVVRNLISNAIKFSPRNSLVVINLDYSQEGQFTFSVKDKGEGMDQNKISTLFNVNTNSSTPGTNGEKGSGLGLLLCADFVQKHKGKIWVESAPEKGSTFYFTIPENIYGKINP